MEQPLNKEPIHILAGDDYRRVVKLSASVGYALGEAGDYRLLSAALGNKQVILYEAVSGTDRYPPGRNMHVALSFEELDLLITAYTQFQAEQQERERKEREQASNDFDPFLDPDDLP